jgi:hypothetical protein
MYSSTILNLATRWRQVACFTPLADLPAREIVSDTHWREGWVASTAGLDSVEKRKIFFFCRE